MNAAMLSSAPSHPVDTLHAGFLKSAVPDARLVCAALEGVPLAEVKTRLRALGSAEFTLWVMESLLDDATRRARDEAEHAHNALRALVHDSSNALSAVCGNLEFVERMAAQLPETVREALVDAADAGRSMQDLVARSGDLMALEQNRMMPARWVKLDAFVRALRLPRDVVIDTAGAPPQLLVRDAVLARSVRFLAVRAHSAGGARLRIARGPGGLSILVTDTGPAVSPDAARQMLTRSWRGEDVDTARVERTHGFHLASLVARAHDGTLTLESGETGLVAQLQIPQPELKQA